MPIAMQRLISRGYWAPAGDDGSDIGGGTPAPDRGDEVKSPLDTAGKGDKLDDEVPPAADDESAETAAEAAERERAEAEAEAKRRIRVPKARLDEVLNKAKAREQTLLEEIDKLKGGQQTASATRAVGEQRAKINELQDTYEDLILDGKKDEARKVRRHLRGCRGF